MMDMMSNTVICKPVNKFSLYFRESKMGVKSKRFLAADFILRCLYDILYTVFFCHYLVKYFTVTYVHTSLRVSIYL